MNNEKLVSVVIAAYNTEKYITSMMDCLVKQTYQNLQIIIVDDGSCDGTAMMIKRFRDIDSRIEYYYQKNQGVSMARNLGISKIRGTKVFFFDSDDTFEFDLIEKCMKYAEKYNVESVLYGYANKVNGNIGKRHMFQLHGVYSGRSITENVLPAFLGYSYSDINTWIKGKKTLREGKEHTALWRIMLDVNTIRDAGIEFDRRLSLGEDTKFINEYLLHTASVGILEDTLYYLTIRDGSANMTNKDNPLLMTENKLKLIEARKEIDRLANEQGIETNSYWRGTMVLSAVQLALRLSHNTNLQSKENKIIYRQYVENKDVKEAIAVFAPCFAIKAIPFWLLKYHLENLLYNICKILPERIVNKAREYQ